MANYEGTGRTNYFAVKDPEAFRVALAPYAVTVVESGQHPGKVAVLDDDGDGGGWNLYDPEAGPAAEDVDIVDLITPHLADGQVAVVMEAGHEKHRYVYGYAIAFNAAGDQRRISLSDIYTLAKDLGTGITDASY